jgi:predicted kinase
VEQASSTSSVRTAHVQRSPAAGRLILICGLPGAGKTTFAKHLERELGAVRVCPDEWKYALGVDFYDEGFRVRLEKRLSALSQELLGLGQTVINSILRRSVRRAGVACAVG